MCQIYLDTNISKTARDRGSVPKRTTGTKWHSESNGHVIESEDGGLTEVCLHSLSAFSSYTMMMMMMISLISFVHGVIAT